MGSIRDDALSKARVLAEAYGHKLEKPVVYTQGVALAARLQLARLDDEYPNPHNNIEGLTADYVENPNSLFDATDGTANYAGVNWASLMGDDQRYTPLLTVTADRFMRREDDGFPSVLDRGYRVEDMFFTGTVLQRATRMTGKARYSDLAADFMLDCADKLLQPNGLYWHCLGSPYFWGRGNGFAALGFSETLLGYQGSKRDCLIDLHVVHLRGLKAFQDEDSGMWRQVVDLPYTYTESSSTCMIGIAIATGISGGWLDAEEWMPVLYDAWLGISAGINEKGHVTRVCVGTGPLHDVEEYVVRDSVTGLDDRGGAMALWFAVEMVNCTS